MTEFNVVQLARLEKSITSLAKMWSVPCERVELDDWHIGSYSLVAPVPGEDSNNTSGRWEVFRIVDIPATRWEPGDVDFAIVATYDTPWQALTAIGCLLAIDTVMYEGMAYDATSVDEEAQP